MNIEMMLHLSLIEGGQNNRRESERSGDKETGVGRKGIFRNA
jgi:hypothetical protein